MYAEWAEDTNVMCQVCQQFDLIWLLNPFFEFGLLPAVKTNSLSSLMNEGDDEHVTVYSGSEAWP